MIAERAVLFKWAEDSTTNPYSTTLVPRMVELKKDKIVFVGSGGCGALGEDRVSILTR